MWHHDVTNPRTCQFSAVCLTAFPFEFRPRTFTIGFYGKNSIISELMILECSFPLTLYRPCAYPGAVLRHASGPTGPRNSSRSFSPFMKSSLPGSSKSRCSGKQTKPSLSKINNSTLKTKLFLSKGFLAHFRGFVVWSVHVSKSSYPRIDSTLSVRRIVMSCFLPDESPKF